MLTVKAAAGKLGVSDKTVYALCAAKKLRHVRVGVGRGKIVVPDAAIEEYLTEQTVVTKPKAASVPPPKPAMPLSRHLKL